MGMIIPPSILMVVWGGLMSVSIGGLFLAGVVPGLLIALSMMATVYVYAKIYDYPVCSQSSLQELATAVTQATLALVTPLIIVGGIVFGFFTPTEASVIAVVYSLILGVFIYRSIAPRELPKILYDSGRFAAISLFCIGAASAFGWALAYFQIPRALVAEIEAMGLGVVGTGLMIAAAFLIIGVISLAFGLVTQPYGLCLLIILLPDLILALPRLLMPKFVN